MSATMTMGVVNTRTASPTAQPSCRGFCKSLQALRLQHSALPLQQRRRSGLTCRAEAAEAEAPPAPAPTPAASQKIQRKGRDLWNDSYYPTGEDAAAVGKPWYIVDAEGQTLGRLAVLVAHYIRGKHLPTFTPSMDMGGYVVIINCEKVIVTGNKLNQKLYRRHTTGRPGSMKIETFKDLQARVPERILEKAVKGMLTRGRLGNRLFHHMKVYQGPNHPHEAQRPVDITHKISKSPAGALNANVAESVEA